MSYDVVILRRAEEQLAEIATWISQRSLDGAARWLDAFDAAIDQLRENPLNSSLAAEDEFVETEIRHVFFKTRRGATYRAIFTVIDREVRVLHVRGPGQSLVRPEELPK